tara:strand:+ start:105 stop:344 length:240 start_codon:yes stop_codon:yes gene_type:complete
MDTKQKCCKCKEMRDKTEYTKNPRRPTLYLKTCIICLKRIQEVRDFKEKKARQDYLDCCRKNNIVPKRDTFLRQEKYEK